MGERWLWTQKEDIGPPPRFGHVMVYEAARQRAVLFSGYVSGGVFQTDTWEWDGDAWTQVADIGPLGRYYACMAYDDSRQRLVLFGGGAVVGGNWQHLGDTWEWNGAEWTQVADIGPSGRYGPCMAYDTVRQRTVLFGGDALEPTPGFSNETWEWDGTEWRQIEDTGPPGRGYAAMVFDRERECLVLFGGYSGGGLLGDTWEWGTETGWVKRQDIGPRSMGSPNMVYTAEHTVLVGNPPSNTGAVHTWEWDGRLWTQRQDMGPLSRNSTVLTYDSQRGCVVLFGGQLSQEPYTLLGDTWELAITEK
jgi:hypothetical protein